MISKIYVLLFLSFISRAAETSLKCPYEAEIKLIANTLSQCLYSSPTSVSIGNLLECLGGYTVDSKQPFTAEIFREIANFIYVETEEYEMCSENFNALLNAILRNKSNLLPSLRNTNLKNTPRKIRKLVADSIAYQKYYCDNLESQRIEEYEKGISKVRIIKRYGLFEMYTYSSNDIVSNHILRGGSWESSEVNAILGALKNYRKKHNINDPNKVMFLDIGAQTIS
jgi:hypothetical protein